MLIFDVCPCFMLWLIEVKCVINWQAFAKKLIFCLSFTHFLQYLRSSRFFSYDSSAVTRTSNYCLNSTFVQKYYTQNKYFPIFLRKVPFLAGNAGKVYSHKILWLSLLLTIFQIMSLILRPYKTTKPKSYSRFTTFIGQNRYR